MEIEALVPGEFAAPVAVVTGGWSRERDRSLLSGSTVTGALRDLGIETRVLDLEEGQKSLVAQLQGVELAFLAIAGRGAEDGRLQGLLESIGVPYTGSGVFASAAGMHKTTAKDIVAAWGVTVAADTRIAPEAPPEIEARRVVEQCGLPVIVKPVSEGGSIGLALARTSEEVATAIREADVPVMAEEYISGRSVSVGILQDPDGGLHILPPLETEAAGGVYSYAAKRQPGLTAYHCPARLSEAVLQDLEVAARRAHLALPCHGYSRHDFVVGPEKGPVWLEVNTLPGLSREGNLARMAEADGFSYEQLLAHILRTARTDRSLQP
ncbi:D-alanine--D-alanine ligase family protein [Streptomyces jumonjinensis]|uniref:D-alanine--D-alanine ligase family protein n=1 Tax=Streptomyces jumonjinensis TaxID=1945 RepID=UPI00379DB88A